MDAGTEGGKVTMGIWNPVLAALSGLLLAASFPSINVSFLAWVALVPLFGALRGKTLRQGFRLGWIAGMTYFAGTVYWVTHSIYFYGGIPFIAAAGIMLLLCAYLAVYAGLFGAATVRIRHAYPSLFFLGAPLVWTTLELARTYVFSGFPWSLLGYSQYSFLPVIQIADVTGVYGISFLIVLVNAALAELFFDRRRFVGAGIAVLAVAGVLGYGFMKLRAHDEAKAPITISVIQGNIEQDHKWDPAYQAQTFSVYKRLTLAAAQQHPDLIIWPETATPFYFAGARESDTRLSDELLQFVKEHKLNLLFGSPTFEIRPGGRIVASNSAFFSGPRGSVEGRYDKMHLVPFGEYVPFKQALFFLEKMVETIGDFQAGARYTVVPVPYQGPSAQVAKVSTVVCYEIIFPDLVRQFPKRGADVLTTITNDAWFGKTAAPYQHFSMAVFRAVENRVPIARAANTGVSGFIDSKGHILGASKIFTEGFLTHGISPGTERTFYTNYGDIFSYICVIVSLGLIIPFRRKSRGGK